MDATNFVHVEPDSHFYTDFQQILETIRHAQWLDDAVEQIRIGVENSIKQGYAIQLVPAEKTLPTTEADTGKPEKLKMLRSCDSFGLIIVDPEHPAVAWSRGYARAWEREQKEQ